MGGLRRGAGVVGIVVGLGAAGCADLPEIPENECGNGVVEPGEDCDIGQGEDTVGTCGKAPKAGAAACRYQCARDGSIPCPDDDEPWVCGVDGICRRPSEPRTWVPAYSPVPEGRCDDLLVADLDADGVSDVIAVAPPTVTAHYFGTTAAMPVRGDSLVVGQTPRPAVGDLGATYWTGVEGDSPWVTNGSAQAGMTMNYARGLGILLGTSERTLSPVASAVVTNPSADALLAPYLIDGPVISTVGYFGYNDAGVIAFVPPGKDWNLLVFGAGGDGERAGEGVVGRFAPLPCDQLAIPVNLGGRGHVRIVSPCDAAGKKAALQVADVALPPGVQACKDTGKEEPPGSPTPRCRPLHVLDIDSNGWPDLVIVDDAYRLHLAFGDGKSFRPRMDADPSLAGFASLAYAGPKGAGAPLVVGDLNGDCALDVVDATHVFMSYAPLGSGCGARGVDEAGAYVDVVEYGTSHYWTEALIADLNHDGRPDLVAGSAFGAGITVQAGTDGALFNGFSIVTSSPTKQLATGDFDGDGVTDLAFAEIGPQLTEGAGTYDTLSISFGAVSAAPSVPYRVADVQGLRQILPTLQQDLVPDMVRDLVVSARVPQATGGEALRVYLFPGDTTRQIMAPYVLADDGTGAASEAAHRSVIGHFNGAGTPDVAVLARPLSCKPGGVCPLRVWLLPTDGTGFIEPVVPNATPGPGAFVATASETLPPELRVTDVLLANGGHGADAGADRLVAAAPAPDGTYLATATASGGRLVIEQAQPLPVLAGFDIHSPGTDLEAQLRTIDVDGDGWLDAVLLSPGDGEANGVAVALWDPAAGRFAVEGAARLGPADLSGLQCGFLTEKGKKASLSAAALPPETGRAHPLVVVDTGAAYKVRWKEGKLEPECFWELGGGSAVASGDFDGDGIEDIVVSTANGLAVYYGLVAPLKGDPVDVTYAGDSIAEVL